MTLKKKASWVYRQTLEIHKRSPETRVASSLSNIEIFTTLYYGKILNFDPQKPYGEDRDRFIISKGHGSISMYPILGDLGFFDINELQNVCKNGSFLGGIPDPIIPGYETINGSLGHGLGVACGMALALKKKKSKAQVFVMTGDGELNEGSNWEAMMFASHHQLDNLNLIVDDNRTSMMNFSVKILDMISLKNKFKAFGFDYFECNGHSVSALQKNLLKMKKTHKSKPKVLRALTIKGRGVPKLELNPLSHITAINAEEIEKVLSKEGKYL